MSQFHDFFVDGFALTGDGDYGTFWRVNSADGWFAATGVRSNAEPRMQQDGDWRGRTLRTGRVFTFRGTVKAPDAVALERAGRQLSSILSSGYSGPLVGGSPAGTLATQVWLEDKPLFTPASSRLATWQLVVAAEESDLFGPERYSSAQLASTAGGVGRVWPRVWPRDWGLPPGVTPGSLRVDNAGNVSYLPRLRVDGPVTNPVITMVETGDRIAYRGTIAAGQWLDIDCKLRRVLLNGQVSVRQAVTFVGAWMAVPVGGASISWTADSAGGAATLSAWGYEGAYA